MALFEKAPLASSAEDWENYFPGTSSQINLKICFENHSFDIYNR